MADSDFFTGVQTELADVGGYLIEIIKLLRLSPNSPPDFAESTLSGFNDALLKATKDCSSYSQRWTTLASKELLCPKAHLPYTSGALLWILWLTITNMVAVRMARSRWI